MVILGLGSNIGDRLTHLRNALLLIHRIPQFSVQQVSPVYLSDALLPENAPATWDKPYLNLALRCETTLSPYALLHHTKQIETTLGRIPEADWGPRAIDIDLLAWDDLIQYDNQLHIPHEHLHERPFALWGLADVAPNWIYPLPGPFAGKRAIDMAAQWGPRNSQVAPLQIQQIAHSIDGPQLLGIVNLTPDSFSDGNQYNTTPRVIQHIQELVNAGADILDLGAESTRPGASPISAHEEWQRLGPILKILMKERERLVIPPKISIDTRQPEVLKKALALGTIDWLNDISGLDNLAMREIVAGCHCDVVFMHQLGVPPHPSITLPLEEGPVSAVYKWAEHRIQELLEAGIAGERLIFDVGIGYGKTAEQSLELIKNIHFFKKLGVRLLVGHSRKSFLGLFTQRPAAERDLETAVVSQYLASQGVDYLRVHNVDATMRALKVTKAFFNFTSSV